MTIDYTIHDNNDKNRICIKIHENHSSAKYYFEFKFEHVNVSRKIHTEVVLAKRGNSVKNSSFLGFSIEITFSLNYSVYLILVHMYMLCTCTMLQ